jgi:hypothetical protein
LVWIACEEEVVVVVMVGFVVVVRRRRERRRYAARMPACLPGGFTVDVQFLVEGGFSWRVCPSPLLFSGVCGVFRKARRRE